jgi:hypothetical protein
MMTTKDLAILVDSYADAKASGNKYLIQTMIAQLERALDEVFNVEGEESSLDVIESVQSTEEY